MEVVPHLGKTPIFDDQNSLYDTDDIQNSGVKLKCGLHDCPSKCHQVSDHSKMECLKLVTSKCSRGHARTIPCPKANSIACRSCFNIDQAQQRRRERDAKLDAERQRKQSEYALKLAEAQAEIARLEKMQNDNFEDAERQKVLSHYQQEIEHLKSHPNPRAMANATATATNVTGRLTPINPPDSSDDTRQKDQEASQRKTKQRETGRSETSSSPKND